MSSPANRVKVRILVDRSSIEVFGNDGEVLMPACFLPKDDDRSLAMYAAGGTARVASLRVYKLKSAWQGG
jgi:sucrose-6-phosphate hydrolase SacC (GH32 family)